MICDWEKCNDKSPHEWGEEGCEKPTFRCDICGEYFDETVTKKTGERAPFNTVEVCPVEECGSEDYTKMHDGFESGDEVVVLHGRRCIKGVYLRPSGPVLAIIETNGSTYDYPNGLIFGTTKSGWLKLCERLESKRAEIDDALKSADEEIKKIEGEEKCRDR
jgi:hypothetical protein